MALTCTDIGKLVHPYLDGEFSDEDRVALEQHTHECAACRDLVQYEMAFKAGMRAKLAPPRASGRLRRRVLGALDEVDRLQGEAQPRRWVTWLLPSGAAAAAAAAIALFFLYPDGKRPARESASAAPATQPFEARPVADPFIEGHRRALPVSLDETTQMQREASRFVGVSVRVPRFREVGGEPAGAWLMRLDEHRNAAQFSWKFPKGNVSVYVFDSSAMRPITGTRRRVGNAEVLCDKKNGYNKFFYEKDGVGHVVVSGDLAEDELVRLISADLRSR